MATKPTNPAFYLFRLLCQTFMGVGEWLNVARMMELVGGSKKSTKMLRICV